MSSQFNTATRFCHFCQSPYNGRSDKKFCNDNCRSAYNNQRYYHIQCDIRNINTILRRNRQILAAHLTAALTQVRISKQQLYVKGFNFSYYTHTIPGKGGDTYYFCYDLGYLSLDAEKLLIVKRKGELCS